MRLWISWCEPGEDSRPAREWTEAPPWWETGIGDGYTTICAVVDAADHATAYELIRRFWNPSEWRFCEQRPSDWAPPADRFPPQPLAHPPDRHPTAGPR